MTGKEFGLVFFVAVAASAGTAALTHVMRADDGAEADRMKAIAARLDRIEQVIGKSEEASREFGRQMTDVRERLGGLEARTTELAEKSAAGLPLLPAGAVEEPVRPGRAKRIRMPSIEGGPIRLSAGELLGADGKPVEFQVAEATKAFDEVNAAVGAELQGLRNGMRMRMLPEEERWAKAKEELNLTDAQVDLIKRAVADRDAAMKDAFQVTREGETGTGGRISIRSLDSEKASAAQESFRSTVDQTLDDGQKKTWKEKGYDHAFGRSPGGTRGAVMIATDIQIADTVEKTTK
ncbi:MAG: hypothetical protein HMLKMBBP_01833 [Planctomycetes bacterium]|nr:hypothetical protein [Planctomycetota bacterium]